MLPQAHQTYQNLHNAPHSKLKKLKSPVHTHITGTVIFLPIYPYNSVHTVIQNFKDLRLKKGKQKWCAHCYPENSAHTLRHLFIDNKNIKFIFTPRLDSPKGITIMVVDGGRPAAGGRDFCSDALFCSIFSYDPEIVTECSPP